MTKNTILSLLFFFTAFPFVGFAQKVHPFDPYYGYAENVMPSVEAFSMSKYGMASPSLYTGSMSYEVPLYMYADPDFQIPLTLDYSFSGYKPSNCSGTVGMGWFLNCGGIITREVIGYPDERNMECGEKGYYYTLTDGKCNYSLMTQPSVYYYSFDQPIDNNDILSSLVFHANPAYGSNRSGFPWPGSIESYDTSSDIYHFNFEGKHGDFVLNKDYRTGEIKARVFNSNVPYGEIEIVPTICKNSFFPFFKFTITTGDGYKYEFGESLSNIEYSYNSYVMNDQRLISASGYKLYKITSPCGKTVDFQYSQSQYDRGQHSFIFHKNNNISLHSSGLNLYAPEENKKAQNKTISFYPLKSVTVNGKILYEMKYDERGEENDEFNRVYYNNDINYSFSSLSLIKTPALRLSSIIIYDKDGKCYDTINLEHSYTLSSSGTNKASPKMFLKAISDRNGKTSFDYYHAERDCAYPTIDCTEKDHWGFYKKNGGGVPIEYFEQQDNSLYNISKPCRDPNYENTCYGALVKITYPTGGYSEIEYEPNDAGKLLDWTMQEGEVIKNNDLGFKIGGIRVRCIKNHSKEPAGVNDYVEYKYIDRQTGKSSGTLLSMPRYALFLEFSYSGLPSYLPESEKGYVAVYGDDSQYNFVRDCHIGYSYVQAYHPDGSFEEYQFIDYESCPDEYDGVCENNKSVQLVQCLAYPGFDIRTISIHPLSRDKEKLFYPCTYDYSLVRGNEKAVRSYDKYGKLILETLKEYGCQELGYTTRYSDAVTSFFEYDPFCLWSYLKNTETTKYFYDENGEESGSVKQMKSFGYNFSGQINNETINNGIDEIICYYSYLNEGKESINSSFKSLLSDAKKVIEVDGERYIIGAEHYDYDQKSNPRPTSITSYIIEKPIPIVNSSDGLLLSGCDTRVTKFKYDNYGRLLRTDFPGGAYITYTWTSDGKYIASKSVNADDNMIKYEWKDMIGLSKMQDAAGRTETYLYDSRNRLIRRTDTNGNPTEKYYYHLINE